MHHCYCCCFFLPPARFIGLRKWNRFGRLTSSNICIKCRHEPERQTDRAGEKRTCNTNNTQMSRPDHIIWIFVVFFLPPINMLRLFYSLVYFVCLCIFFASISAVICFGGRSIFNSELILRVFFLNDREYDRHIFQWMANKLRFSYLAWFIVPKERIDTVQNDGEVYFSRRPLVFMA